MAELPVVLSFTDLARLLQVSKKTISRFVEGGQLPPPIKLGRKTLRWSRADLEYCRPDLFQAAS
jgi:predicted DNA-binding transcriptional regulator AlpA